MRPIEIENIFVDTNLIVMNISKGIPHHTTLTKLNTYITNIICRQIKENMFSFKYKLNRHVAFLLFKDYFVIDKLRRVGSYVFTYINHGALLSPPNIIGI